MSKAKFLINAFIALNLASTLLTGCGAAPMSAPASDSAASGDYSYAAPAAESVAAAQDVVAERAQPADMFFKDYGVNGFVESAQDALSTFAVDVDTGSYTLARSYLNDGLLPPTDAIRVEEFVNYFDYDYALPAADETFGITIDGAPSPFAPPDHQLLRIGIQGYDIRAEDRQNAALTFVIDVSGSMDMENRLGLAKQALNLLVEELRPTDAVAIVVYGSTARVVLPMTSAAEKATIIEAIGRLLPDGSTNAEEGLQLAYEQAWRAFNPQAINRVVLLSDGVANVGRTGPGAILETIAQYAAKGITLTTVGMGMGNYNDTLMEQLADQGDGFYSYVDDIDEAHRLFVEELPSTLQTIAKDAKVQVEFNPALVTSYRLVGYENRDVADDDFRNDAVDAGEIGAGHSVTALYEVVLHPQAPQASANELAEVNVRWQDLASGEVLETNATLTYDELTPTFVESDLNFQLAVTVAQYGEILRDSAWSQANSLGTVLAEAQRINTAMADLDLETADVSELVDLLWRANELAGSQANGQ